MTARVLLTGATGFVGREVALALLRAGRPLVALARARQGRSAVERIAEALATWPPDARLHVVEGDLGAPDCGIDPAGWNALRESIDTVIHCAGDPTFSPERLDAFETAHVDGPCRLLQGLAAGRLRRFVHVSTAYVCGRRRGLILESERDVGQRFHNAYERVKLASESALLAAGGRAGVAVHIARPSIVVGAAPCTRGGTPSTLFFEFVRMTASLAAAAAGRRVRLRIEAAAHAPFNIVPVEYVAVALVHLAGAPSVDAETVHLVAPDAPTQSTVLAAITGRLGVNGLELVDRLDDPSPLERRVARMLGGYRDYLSRDLTFDDANARRILPADVLRRASLSPPALAALIDLALRTSPGAAPGSRSARVDAMVPA